MDCRIDPETLRCVACGSQFRFKDTRSNCGTPRPGLGDMVAAGLSAIGITKERVTAAVGRDCGCKGRQEAMNEWGKKNLGIG